MPEYLLLRIRQVVAVVMASFGSVGFGLLSGKERVVHQMFWGRGSLYRASFHLIISVFTLSVFLAGLVGRLQASNNPASSSLAVAQEQGTNYDLVQQGSSLTTVFAIDKTPRNYNVIRHTVRRNETLASIAKKYGVTKDTIRWANDKKISYFNDNVDVGWELLIPEINGVLYTAKSGDDLGEVVALTAGNRFDIIELNSLVPPRYGLKPGQKIFIPNGRIKPPTPPVIVGYVPGSGGNNNQGSPATGNLGSLPAGYFSNPLSHPRCSGYVFMRGYTGWHDGVDLAKNGGCPIRAVAAGTVTHASWDSWGGGYMIGIDHGNGVESRYLHGTPGTFWVKVGQRVKKGQDLMYMGSSGNSTGVHLHFTLKYRGYSINPRPYVPY